MKVSLVQLDTRDDRAANLAALRLFVAEAAEAGSELVLLPETCLYRGDPDLSQVDSLPLRDISELAASYNIAVLAGGAWTDSGDPKRPYNTSVFVDEHGTELAAYHKVHLFRLDHADVTEDEASYTTPGAELVTVSWRGWVFGLSICYDLRFPEQYRALARAGADVLCVPANFSAVTGKSHWAPLLTARAVENLCYVLAPAQCGVAPDGFAAHGHTLAVSPWGELLADAGTSPGVVTVELDRAELDWRRADLRAPAEARPDVYAREVRRA